MNRFWKCTQTSGPWLEFLFLLCSVCSADSITVDLNGSGDFMKIQPAIDAAADGDTIQVGPGEYLISEPVTFRGKAIRVRGVKGPEETILCGGIVFENGESDLSILEDLKVTGGVSCKDSSPILTDCTFSGNCALGGWHAGGHGVYCEGSSPTLVNCTISGNSAWDGGGLYCCNNSSPILKGCTISGNSAIGNIDVYAGGSGGGVYCEDSSPILTDCTISGNLAMGQRGGGLCCDYGSSPILTNCAISGNWAIRTCDYVGSIPWIICGGVFCGTFSSPILVNCTVSGNSGWGVGWGSPTLTSCIVWGNAGGSIAVDMQSTPQVTFSCVEGAEIWPGLGNSNEDPGFCGWTTREIWVHDQEEFENALHFSSFNLALVSTSPCIGAGRDGTNMGSDMGVCAEPGQPDRLIRLEPGTYRITGLNLSHRVSIDGAGQDETLIVGTVSGLQTGSVLSNVTVTAGMSGGIVVPAEAAPRIRDCTISGNRADYEGGGVYCSVNSSPTLVNCTISGNGAEGSDEPGGSGGGVFCDRDSSPTFINCTISGNLAGEGLEGGGCGGAMYCSGGSSPRLTNCTISGNSAKGGSCGGVWCWNASPIIVNCIAWNNAGNSIEAEDNLQISYSCVEGDPPWPGTGNINVNPLFVSNGVFDFRFVRVWWNGPKLPDFVVEAPDYHLQVGSPCIDKGGMPSGVPTIDIEGNARPCGAVVDIGAYEFGCNPFLRGDVDMNGKLDVTDVIQFLNYQFIGSEILDCLDTADIDDDGELTITDAIRSLNYQFTGTAPAPEPPGPFTCGPDVNEDAFTPCEYPVESCE